jgi:hypothetical protein
LPTPDRIQILAGNGQTGRVSQAVPDPLVVRVLDDDSGEPVAGVTVVWVTQGGGSVSPETVETGSDGRAMASLVLGPTVGDQATTAAVGGLDGLQVTFTTKALAEAIVMPRIPTTPNQSMPSH